MSDKLSDKELNKIREFYGENPKYWFPHRLIAEIDRLSAENKALREIVGECGPELKEYLENRDHDIWGELILDDDGNEQCPADCRKCYQERLLARIDAALEEG